MKCSPTLLYVSAVVPWMVHYNNNHHHHQRLFLQASLLCGIWLQSLGRCGAVDVVVAVPSSNWHPKSWPQWLPPLSLQRQQQHGNSILDIRGGAVGPGGGRGGILGDGTGGGARLFGPRGIRKPGSSGTTSRPSHYRANQQQQQQPLYPIVEDLAQDDDENQETKNMISAFLTRDDRNTFIARVYAILSGQLLVTALSVLMFGLNPQLGAWMRQAGSFVPLLSLGLSSIAWFLVCGSVRARREAPMKWQLLTLFTVGESIAVGFISSFYHFSAVLSAMGATAVAASTVSAYTILNKNSKYDLSQWGAALSSAGMIFLSFIVIHLLEQYGIIPAGFLPIRDTWMSFAGAVLFSFYLAYHTKLIVAGKYSKFQMNEKDYVFGAMSLYNDIINMFIYILRLIGEDQRK